MRKNLQGGGDRGKDSAQMETVNPTAAAAAAAASGGRRCSNWCEFSHGQDGSHGVQRGDEDAALADAGRQQQGPGGLSVGLPVAEDLHGERTRMLEMLTTVNRGLTALHHVMPSCKQRANCTTLCDVEL